MLNFLFAQILHRWTVVAGFCHAGNMADVSNAAGHDTVTPGKCWQQWEGLDLLAP